MDSEVTVSTPRASEASNLDSVESGGVHLPKDLTSAHGQKGHSIVSGQQMQSGSNPPYESPKHDAANTESTTIAAQFSELENMAENALKHQEAAIQSTSPLEVVGKAAAPTIPQSGIPGSTGAGELSGDGLPVSANSEALGPESAPIMAAAAKGFVSEFRDLLCAGAAPPAAPAEHPNINGAVSLEDWLLPKGHADAGRSLVDMLSGTTQVDAEHTALEHLIRCWFSAHAAVYAPAPPAPKATAESHAFGVHIPPSSVTSDEHMARLGLNSSNTAHLLSSLLPPYCGRDASCWKPQGVLVHEAKILLKGYDIDQSSFLDYNEVMRMLDDIVGAADPPACISTIRETESSDAAKVTMDFGDDVSASPSGNEPSTRVTLTLRLARAMLTVANCRPSDGTGHTGHAVLSAAWIAARRKAGLEQMRTKHKKSVFENLVQRSSSRDRIQHYSWAAELRALRPAAAVEELAEAVSIVSL
eukprot:SAG31_NODE_820_length_11808_cov_16.331540_13_plen_473_part_00